MAATAAKSARPAVATASLWRALEDVADPEFPVSVVAMGLIYDVQRHGSLARVEMTFTSMGCPCMEMILMDIRQRLLQEPDIDEVEIDIVWDPPWTSSRLSEAAREQLATWGVSA